MGQLFSGPYHRAELQMRKTNQILDYQPQPTEEIAQLDTELDQRGNTTVDHVFKMTRDVYGQKAIDLKFRAVDWHDYNIDLHNRPSPYDFPAFEHEERFHEGTMHNTGTVTQEGSVLKQVEKSNEKTVNSSTGKGLPASSAKQKVDPKEEKQQKARKTKTKETVTEEQAENKPVSKKALPPKSKKSDKLKRSRVSHNTDLDRCSLEEDGGGAAA